MNNRFFVIATISINKDELETFVSYETKALAIAKDHGGVLERAVRSADLTEVHVLSFPDSAHFQTFREDERIAALAKVRTTAILATSIITGLDAGIYC